MGEPQAYRLGVKPEGLWVRSWVVKIADRGLWGGALALGLTLFFLPGLWAQEPSLREQRAFFKEARSQLLNPSPSARASAVRKLSKLGTLGKLGKPGTRGTLGKQGKTVTCDRSPG